MVRLPDAWLSELLAKNDIVAVISKRVALKQKGGQLWGLCPFHGEKTPSFSVSPQKQLFHCFGCHVGGNVINFIKEYERLSYMEAVGYLAEQVNMVLPERVDDDVFIKERALKDRLYDACRVAALFFHKQLLAPGGKDARDYLSARKLKGKLCARFGVGFAPPGWENLTNHLRDNGFTDNEATLAGLAIKSSKDGGGYYDAFRNRIIFPIFDVSDRIIGFGARALGDEQPKYLNTGDTPIFNKRKNLYGLNFAKAARPADIILVEGYMDVISLNAAGILNVAASLGTALTIEQARLIKRHSSSAYLCYDGDEPGQKAALTGMEVLSNEGLKVKIVNVPDGLDPDDYVKAYGKDAFLGLKDNALTLPSFKLERMAKEVDLATDDGREAFALDACKYIATLKPVERGRYYTLVSRKTGIQTDTLLLQSSDFPSETRNNTVNFRYNREKKLPEETDERARVEKRLICAMAASNEAILAAMQLITPEDFRTPEYEQIASALICALAQEKPIEAALLTASLPEATATALASVFMEDASNVNLSAEAVDCVNVLMRLDFDEKIRALSQEASKDSISPEKRRDLLEKILELQKNAPFIT